MRVLLSGSSGFIGSEVRFFLQQHGINVVPLRRGDPLRTTKDAIFWDPKEKRFNKEAFEGFDGVIHLAGESIFSLWTPKRKKQIFSSRVDGTKLLAKIFSETNSPPKVFISASAVGYYGDRGDEKLTEESFSGNGFLASVCKSWEEAPNELESAGVRVVHPRFGIVLAKHGGALQKIRLMYQLGLGGILGDGEQWMSWIALQDLVKALFFCLANPTLQGPVNCVSPNPIRQNDFAKILAKRLARPLFLRYPVWLLRGLLGEMAQDMLLSSQRVIPKKLIEQGFSFQYSSFESVPL